MNSYQSKLRIDRDCPFCSRNRRRRMDLQIAATARHVLTLLTRNGRDFAGPESALDVVDPPSQPPPASRH